MISRCVHFRLSVWNDVMCSAYEMVCEDDIYDI